MEGLPPIRFFPSPFDLSMRGSCACPFEGYLPSQLFNLESKYGAQGSLEALLERCHKAGLRCMADIVINHRPGAPGGAAGAEGRREFPGDLLVCCFSFLFYTDGEPPDVWSVEVYSHNGDTGEGVGEGWVQQDVAGCSRKCSTCKDQMDIYLEGQRYC